MDAICPKHANMIGVASCKRCIIEALLAENAELKLALAKAIGVNDGDNMGAERIKFFLDLQAENAELRKICRDAYEVWAGSEGIPRPMTASEAYLLQLLAQMRDEVKRGLSAMKGQT